jgi:Holliday junction resolvasome RuvABC endonuclease subunit
VSYRLLAIDPGSKACGAAYFADDDVRPTSTDWFRRDGIPAQERMRYIAEQLGIAACTRRWTPDVIAIERVVLGLNIQTAVAMSQNRGYLLRVLDELFPRARYLDIYPASTKAAAMARGARAFAKGDTRRTVEVMTGLTLPEDVADAVAIGWAAFKIIREQRLVEMADAADQMRLQATP